MSDNVAVVIDKNLITFVTSEIRDDKCYGKNLDKFHVIIDLCGGLPDGTTIHSYDKKTQVVTATINSFTSIYYAKWLKGYTWRKLYINPGCEITVVINYNYEYDWDLKKSVIGSIRIPENKIKIVTKYLIERYDVMYIRHCPYTINKNDDSCELKLVVSKLLAKKTDVSITTAKPSDAINYLEHGYSVYEYLEPNAYRRVYFDIDLSFESDEIAIKTFTNMIKDLKTFLCLSFNVKFNVTKNNNSIHGGCSYHIITNLCVPSYEHLRYLTRNFICCDFKDGEWLNKDQFDENGLKDEYKFHYGTYNFIDPVVSNEVQLFRIPYSYNSLAKICWYAPDRYRKYITKEYSKHTDKCNHHWYKYYCELKKNMSLAYSSPEDFHYMIRNELTGSKTFIQNVDECLVINRTYRELRFKIDKLLDESSIMEQDQLISGLDVISELCYYDKVNHNVPINKPVNNSFVCANIVETPKFIRNSNVDTVTAKPTKTNDTPATINNKPYEHSFSEFMPCVVPNHICEHSFSDIVHVSTAPKFIKNNSNDKVIIKSPKIKITEDFSESSDYNY